MERIKSVLTGEIELDILPRPHLLYPHIPKGGLPKSAFAKKTKPGMGKSLRHEAQLEEIEINYRHIERIPASFEAHRLTEIAPNNTTKYALAIKIFHGYFEEGKDIEDLDYLVDLGKQVGLPKSLLSEFLFTDIGATATQSAMDYNRQELFVTVVPSIRLDAKILMPGLQPLETWLSYIRRAAELQ